MTKKDYDIIAAAIREALVAWNGEDDGAKRIGVQTAANRISRRLREANPRFDRNQFLEACGL